MSPAAVMPGIPSIPLVLVATAPRCTSSRALRASIHIISEVNPSTATRKPIRSAPAPQNASESDELYVEWDEVICLLLCERVDPTVGARRPRDVLDDTDLVCGFPAVT